MPSLQSYRKKLWVDTDILFEKILLTGFEPHKFSIDYIEEPKFGRSEYCKVEYIPSFSLDTPEESKCEFYFLPYDHLRPYASVFTPHVDSKGEYHEFPDAGYLYEQFQLWLECISMFTTTSNYWFKYNNICAKSVVGYLDFIQEVTQDMINQHLELYDYLIAAGMDVEFVKELISGFCKAEEALKPHPHLIPYTFIGLAHTSISRNVWNDEVKNKVYKQVMLYAYGYKPRE